MCPVISADQAFKFSGDSYEIHSSESYELQALQLCSVLTCRFNITVCAKVAILCNNLASVSKINTRQVREQYIRKNVNVINA